MSNPVIHRVIASLNVPRQASLILGVAKAIAGALTGNKWVPTPDPPVATIQTAITDLEAAENAAKSGLKTAVAARNQKRRALLTLLEQEKGTVQKAMDGDPENAHEIAVSAAMGVRKVPVRTKRTFTVRPAPLSGAVEAFTGRVAIRASYEWQYSADGGKTWQSAPSTLRTKTIIAGLQPGVSYAFRFRAITKSGPSDWSDPITVLVR